MRAETGKRGTLPEIPPAPPRAEKAVPTVTTIALSLPEMTRIIQGLDELLVYKRDGENELRSKITELTRLIQKRDAAAKKARKRK